MSFAAQYLDEVVEITRGLDRDAIERVVALLAAARAAGGRLFILGVGGSAANASHAVNDFRKIAGIEAYAPTDNVSELTARTNDEGWATVFAAWLTRSRLDGRDVVLVFSVGGGDVERNVSPNLVAAHRHGARLPAHASSGSSAATAATPRSRPTPASIVPTVNADAHHAARRGVPGRGLAPLRVAPGAQGARDEVGVGPLSAPPRRLPRPRRCAEPAPSCATARPYPPASVAELRDRRRRAAAASACSRSAGCWRSA